MNKLVFIVVLSIAISAWGKKDMPTLSWMGRKEATNITKNVIMKILREDKELSYAKDISHGERGEHGEEPDLFGRVEVEKVSGSACPSTDNILVHGDNLEALHALLPFYAGQVKCIYIDPPYNTGSAFEHYDDNLEHATWLNMMYPRLKLLKDFLSEEGFLCIQIDDSEGAYLKVLCDEIFGRVNYETTLYVRVRYPDKTLKADMAYHKEIEQIHIYRKSMSAKPNLDIEDAGYQKFRFHVHTSSTPFKILELGGKQVEVYAKGDYTITEEEGSSDGLKEVWASGTILDGNSSGRFFRDYLTGRFNEDGYGVLYKVKGIGEDSLGFRYFTGPNRVGATKGKYYQGVPVSKLNGSMKKRIPIHGFCDYAPNFGNCRNEGGADFRGGKKPEILLEYILTHFSNPGDLVLDSFLGSGTTAAVAQKMGRRWIGIEMGEHAKTHCAVRLKKVIDGEQGGILKAVNWKGGGSFRYYELGEPILKSDGTLTEDIPFETMAAHVWFTETKRPFGEVNGEGEQQKKSTVLGVYKDVAYALLYNGILGDKSVSGGNVLTKKTLKRIMSDLNEVVTENENLKTIVIYAEATRLSSETLKDNKIDFRQTPYDLVTRK